jgi:geranylgeranyl diphosphate synthase type I
MEGPEILYRYRQRIEAELVQALPQGDDALSEMQRYAMGWSDGGALVLGKCLRPSLCLLACESLGGDLDRAYPVAVALEMVHNFSLVHDDIEDGDELRHHRPTLWKRYGRDQAIAAGLALWTTAYATLDTAVARGLPAARALAARRVLDDACQRMIEGQHLDISFEHRTDVGLDEYVHMIACKTGALLGASLQIGAIVAGADDEESARFGRFGQQLGLSFQIRDDVLGIWGEGAATGKPVGADIARKKKTLPVLHAFEQTTGADRDLLRQVYAEPVVQDEDLEAVLGILQRWDSRGYAQRLAESYRAQAVETLAQARIDAASRARLDELMSFVLEREY